MSETTRADTERRYAGLTADERDARRLERLRHSAHQLFGEAGYGPTTIERICTAAGVSTRHFYRCYESKEAVLADLFGLITAESYAGVVASLAQTEGQPIRERIPRAFVAHLAPMLRDMRTARITYVEALGVSNRIEGMRLSFRRSLIELVRREGAAAVVRGELRDRDFAFAALALHGASGTIIDAWTRDPDRRPLEDLTADLTALSLVLIAD